ncbi:MAG TPA: shikimate dehydrogenase [Rhizobacter sp.]|nr:shikimate dehydrogenase [Rhizobacter sp.]
MDRYVVAGNPVEHSQSPFIHAQFAEATGQSLDYGRLLCPLDGFAQQVKAFAAAGGRGCNVTVPFKLEAFALAARRGERATLAEAANVLSFEDDGWVAHNTDGIGLVRDIERNAGVPLRGRRVLLIGAGGASAGALGPLIESAPAELVVANRSIDKALALVQRHAALASRHGTTLAARSLADCGAAFDVVINGTATSLQGADIPVAATALKPGGLALDMMYGPAAAGFMAWATRHGAHARDGLGMLVEQAAEAFFIWRGVRPETAPVLAALRSRLATKP